MANSNDAYFPELWAAEAVDLLWEQFVYAGLVHRDFENSIQNFGDTVNTRAPVRMSASRKQNDFDDLTDQDAQSTNIAVKLNQRAYVSFLLGDREMSLSFQDLVPIYLVEAVSSLNRQIDRVIAGQAYQFLANNAGSLSSLDTSNAHDYLIDMRKEFNDKNVTEMFRNLGLASNSETQMQKNDLFKSAERIGDGGEALRNALLGRVAGWDTFRSNNTPSVKNATTATGGALASSASAGATSVTVGTGEGSNFTTGHWITIAGDMIPQRITGISTDTLTISPGLKRNVASGAVVTNYEHALVNQASAIAAGDTTAAVTDGYPAGWMKGIAYDGTGVPQVGQMVAFGTATDVYCIVDVVNSEIWLDRPLDAAIADNDQINLGPDGDYNFAFQRGALAFVNRPLILPQPGTGVRAAVASSDNVSIRVTLSYDAKKQVHRVTLDTLYGIKVLDTNRGGVLLG